MPPLPRGKNERDGMKQETRKTVASLIEVAVKDPEEKAEALARLEGKKDTRRDKMLKSKEAARVAGVHVKTLFGWEKMGKLHPKRLTARRVRWSRNELEEFLGEAAEA